MTGFAPIIIMATLFTALTLAVVVAAAVRLLRGPNGYLRQRADANADHIRQALTTLRSALAHAQASHDRDQFDRLAASYRSYLAAARSFAPAVLDGEQASLVYDEQ